jgi:hypothetical protein
MAGRRRSSASADTSGYGAEGCAPRGARPVLGAPGLYSEFCPRCGAYGQVAWSPDNRKRIRETSEN